MATAGWSKQVITPQTKNIVMMGYANENNKYQGVMTDIHARAIAICEDITQVFCQLEINYITNNLYNEIFKQVKDKGLIQEKSQLFICANHTHAAPGGYGDHLYYEIPTPGFQPEVFSSYVRGTVKAIEEALNNQVDARLEFSKGEIPKEEKFGCIRSLNALHSNEEFKNTPKDRLPDKFEALDRTLYQLVVKTGDKVSVINWLGLHTTSIPNDNTLIHFDNKGYAAQMFEEKFGGIAIFAQGSSGDVSPNYIYDKKLKRSRGPHVDGDANAKEIGRIQFETSSRIIEGDECHLKNQSIRYYNFSKLKGKDKQLSEPCFGVPFAQGTLEGPGIGKLEASILKTVSKVMHLGKKGDGKSVFLNPQQKKIVNIPYGAIFKPLSIVDPFIGKLNKLIEKEEYKNSESWYDTNLPVQVVEFDKFVIIGIPFEITTIAAKRVRKRVKSIHPNKDVIVSSYTNAYAGYITTPEEYSKQCYEGGHTVFGKWSQPVLTDKIEEVLNLNT